MIALLHGHYAVFEDLICGGADVDTTCPLTQMIQCVKSSFVLFVVCVGPG